MIDEEFIERYNHSRQSSLQSPVHRRVFLAAHFQLSPVIDVFSLDGQVESAFVNGSYFIDVVASLLNAPLLIGVAGFLPNYHLGPTVSAFPSDVESETVEDALNNVAFVMLHESPSLVESSVLLPLDDPHVFLESAFRHVQSLSRLVVADNG